MFVKGEKHFTASVWIISKTNPKKVLLVHHKKLKKWTQPGGHIEKFENPIEASIREVREETGIDIEFLFEKVLNLDKAGIFLPVPEFFIEQTIPKSNKEPAHFHIDIQYIVNVSKQKLTRNQIESYGIGWFSKNDALKLNIHENTRVILLKIL